MTLRAGYLMATALLAGCGGSAPDGAAAGGSNSAGAEIVMDLPPPLPVEEPAPGFSSAGPAAPAAKAKAEPPAPPAAPKQAEAPAAEPTPEAPTELVEASPPIPAEGLAGYIRGAGFECDQVVTTRRAPGGGTYKFDCANGGSYRGTMKRNHLYFRPWRG